METGNLDNILKSAMQFDEGEIPEPNPKIHVLLRKRITVKKNNKEGIFARLIDFFNIDIKLYHAGMAVAAVALVFIVLRNTNEETKHVKSGIIIADTNTGSDTNIGSSPRGDTFQANKSTLQVN